MCLLTFIPPGVQPDADALRTGARCNNDGHGFAILVPGEDDIRIGKGMEAEEVIAAFMALRAQYPNGPALFHSRLTTHGETNVDNCHPFVVNGDTRTVVAHNGILPRDAHPAKIGTTVEICTTKTGVKYETVRAVYDDRSDTRILADDLLMARWSNMDSRHARKRLTRWLGRTNKILVLTTDPTYRRNSYLFNADLGLWTGGIWYSNTSFRSYRSSTGAHEAWWSHYGTAAGGTASGVRSGMGDAYEDDLEGWEEYHYGYVKDKRGIWVPPTSQRFHSDYGYTVDEADANDPSSWPTTLGGTRVVKEGPTWVTFVTCDLCGTGNSDPETGLCLDCWACQDCYEYLGQCECYGTPRPSSLAYERLVFALERTAPGIKIRKLVIEYRNLCTKWMEWSIGQKATADRGPLAITAGPAPQETALSVTENAWAEIDAAVAEVTHQRLQDDPEAPEWAKSKAVVSVSPDGRVEINVS